MSSEKMKKFMTESEMENYLKENGYNICDEEECIDSVEVIEHAIDLGYVINLNEKSQTLEFTLSE